MPTLPIPGVKFLRDASGEATAVHLDLRMHGELWEEIFDSLLVKLREADPRETLAQVQKRLESSRGRR